MKFLHKFWPWKVIDELEAQVSKLNVELAQEKSRHETTKIEHRAIKAELKLHQDRAFQNQKHMKKMAEIIAIKGGIIG